MKALIIKSLQGQTTPAEEARLTAWRNEAPANDAEYLELQRLWQLTGLVRWQDSASHVPTADDLLSREAERRRRRRVRRSAWWQAAAAIAAVLVGITFFVEEPQPREEFHVREIVTGPDEMATAELEDGTVVRLAESSRLRVTQMRGSRNVSLDGRAFFAVAHDPRRPFRVAAGAGEVVVLGTQFDLMSRDEEIQLVVVEGAVEISSAGRTLRVGAGEASEVVDRSGPKFRPLADSEEEVGWVGSLLVFQATPLNEVAEILEERFGRDVVVTDTVIARRTVTAWFSTEDLWQVMTVVCRVADAHCRMSGETVVVEP
jgi:transmembrane sensor